MMAFNLWRTEHYICMYQVYSFEVGRALLSSCCCCSWASRDRPVYNDLFNFFVVNDVLNVQAGHVVFLSHFRDIYYWSRRGRTKRQQLGMAMHREQLSKQLKNEWMNGAQLRLAGLLRCPPERRRRRLRRVPLMDCVMVVVLADCVPSASDLPICCSSQVRPIRPAPSASAAAAEPHVQTRVPQMLALK